MPESARRDNAVFRARQAAALAEIPEPERVTGIAAQAAELVRTTGSARLRRELLALSGHVRGWQDTPERVRAPSHVRRGQGTRNRAPPRHGHCWQRITFRTTTHDAGHRITSLDFDLARHIDAIAARHGAKPAPPLDDDTAQP